MTSFLGKSELFVYSTAWITSNVCSLHCLVRFQEDYLRRNSSHLRGNHELVPGWIMARHIDSSDFEWTTWKQYISISWIALFVHFITSELLRNINKSLIPYWYTSCALFLIFVKYGAFHICIALFHPVLYFLTLKVFQNRQSIWIMSLLNLVIVGLAKNSEYLWGIIDKHTSLTDEDVNLLFISMGWRQVRCMSCCLDEIDKKHLKTENTVTRQPLPKNKETPKSTLSLKDILSYSLYLPTFFMGPLILYADFQNSFNTDTPLINRLKTASCDILMILAYSYVMEVALHFIYFLAMKEEASYILNMPGMALCGAGLWMGVQFHLKYVIIYGTGGALATLDNVDAPPTPRCILRIHLYSHMWKYFDVGLYRFLVKYIYKPLLEKMTTTNLTMPLNKMIASFITFVFIFLWHDATKFILVWCVLNYIGLTLESAGSLLGNTKMYQHFCRHFLKTNKNKERFVASVTTPLLIMSALSNFYLFAGLEVGNIFVKRFFSEPWFNILFIYICLFTCCIVSSVLRNVPSRTARRLKYFSNFTL